MEKFCEATVGHRGDKEIAERWVQLFSTPYFLVSAVRPPFPNVLEILLAHGRENYNSLIQKIIVI